MKVSTERLERSQVAFEIEVEPEQFEKSMERAYRRLVGRYTIPGFRKGKAPRVMVERYLGKAALMEEALDILVPEVYNKAIKDEGLPVIGQPHIEILQIEPNVSFKATVALEPTVELGNYADLHFALETPEIPDEKVAESLEELRQGFATWNEVDRPVASGDLVTMDIDGQVETDGGTTPFIKQDAAGYVVREGRTDPVAGFSEKLIGAEKGAILEFTLPLPEDYPARSMAGKPVNFKVTIQDVKEQELPELNDEFARGLGEGHESLDALRERIRNNLREQAEREVRDKLETEILDALVDISKIEYPEMLVEHEIDHLIDSDRSIWRDRQGKIDEYLNAIGQTEEQFRERYREEATKRVLRSLVLEEVAKREGIDVSDGEIDAEVERMSASFGEQQELARNLFGSEERRASIRRSLRVRKTMDRLLAVTTGQADAAAVPAGEASKSGASEAVAETGGAAERRAEDEAVEQPAQS